MRRLLLIVSLLAVSGTGIVVAQSLSVAPGNEHFQRTWERTDKPVADGVALRTWLWAPEAFTNVLTESYAESPGGQREVQYFDKARMEITDPNGDSNSVWYVTNGLLVVELVTGQMQVGNATFEARSPATVNVVGDALWLQGFPLTYADVGDHLDQEPYAEGELIDTYYEGGYIGTDEWVWAIGEVTPGEPSFYDDILDFDIHAAHFVTETNHTIAAPFWEFMNATGTVYEDGQFIDGPLFENPYFATGFPITEPNWVWTTVGGEARWVLFQCFERRCLTYTPGNPEGFIVEAGNVGQHYYQWRYEGDGGPPPAGTPTATATPGTTATATATATSTPTATATSTPTPSPTPTDPPQQNCHASYPDFCIPPPPPDLNCDDFSQTDFTVRHNVPNPDPHRLDTDEDGVGCES